MNTTLAAIEKMDADNANYKKSLQRHFEGADVSLIVTALLENRCIKLEDLTNLEVCLIEDFISLVEDLGIE